MTATPSPTGASPATSSPTGASPAPGSDQPGGRDDITYAEAQAELDAILHELDGDEVDVDVLGARVRRAAELLRLCRSRIAAARFEVEQVVGELEVEADEAAAADEVDDDGAGLAEGDDEPADDTDDEDDEDDEVGDDLGDDA
jgi:exodeoxyribonuclease VII small subunit